MTTMFSSEFIEKFKNGQKEFDGIELHYADISGRNFERLKLKNSRLFLTNLRDCLFKNVVFENCEISFCLFGRSNFEDVKFIKCQIGYSGFTTAAFSNVYMEDTKLSWVSLIDAKLGGLQMKNCTEFMVFRNISELTPTIFERALTDIQPIMMQLDFDMQQKIKHITEIFVQQHGIPVHANLTAKSRYSKSAEGYTILDTFIDSAIRMYGQEPPYKQKNIYDTKTKYKK
ncbi:MAG: pentapeptide repeat-containing protein [Candidatus Aenigmatarchaeota archaeon]